MRALLVATILLVTLATAPAVHGSGTVSDDACELGFTLEGHHRVTASGDDAIVLMFEVESTLSGWFYYALAFAMDDDPMNPLAAQEGALAGRIIENMEGEVINTAATKVFPFQAHVSVGPLDLQVTGEPEGFCGFIASGGHQVLEPGTYRMIVPGRSDFGSERGALIPEAAILTDVQIVTGLDVTPQAGCDVNAKADVFPFGANVLSECTHSYDVAQDARAYWILYADRSAGQDPMRQATWSTPGEEAQEVSGFLIGAGPQGEHRLEVSTWIGLDLPPNPFLPPGAATADHGVSGIFVGA